MRRGLDGSSGRLGGRRHWLCLAYRAGGLGLERRCGRRLGDLRRGRPVLRCRRLLGGGLFGRSLLYRRRLFGLHLAAQAVGVGPTANAVSLRVFDARGMGLDADSERESKIECLLVRHTELFGELVHSNFLLGQLVPS